jgi:hypothetical protein
MNPFRPRPDFISPSLNQARLVELPGVALPPEVQGKRGYDLLSAAALREMIWPQAAALGLEPNDPNLLPRFNGRLTSPIAQTIASDYGRRLGWLLLCLKRGDPANRAARPDWGAAQWAFWAGIRRVWLGGGLVCGDLGQIAATTAESLLHDAGFPEMEVRVSSQPADLPLLGAARLAPPETAVSLLFDFGHTSVKRAIAYHQDGGVSLRPLPAAPAPCRVYEYRPWPLQETAVVHRGMLDIIAATWEESQRQTPVLLLAIAAYLYRGHLIPAHLETGCYSRLQILCDHLGRFLTETVSQRLGQPITLRLINDAAAAGIAHWQEGEREGETAVITLGTSLGIGFPTNPASEVEW